jgi:hypothetical protein
MLLLSIAAMIRYLSIRSSSELKRCKLSRALVRSSSAMVAWPALGARISITNEIPG